MSLNKPSSKSIDYLNIFCRQIRNRSNEHHQAVHLLSYAELPSQIVSILRQELDSMVRVVYLLTIPDMILRDELIKASVEGNQWELTTTKGKKRRVTDKEMVELANHLQGWTKSVYRFGCAFIHLSNFHDYQDRDPMDMISNAEKDAILKHMQYYHGGPHSAAKIDDLIPYLPQVFEKIASNLECYIRDLKERKVITISAI